jgi:hypothetical protein
VLVPIYLAVSSSQCLTLDLRGDWWLFRLGHDSAGVVTATSLDKALCLTGLSLDLSSKGDKPTRCNPSVISVGSSFVLLAGIAGDDPAELVLLLWDIQYSVVLATQRFALPSTVGCSPKLPLILELVPASRSQALLVLSPTLITTSTRTVSTVAGRSTVFVVPLAVPPASTIALSMGKSRDTRRWLRKLHTSTQTMVSDKDRGHHRVMQSVQQALEQGCPNAAEAAFFNWVEQETSRPHRLRKVDATSADGEGGENRSNNGPVSKTHPKTPLGKDKWKVILPGPLHPLTQIDLGTLNPVFVSSVCIKPIKWDSAAFPAFRCPLSVENRAISY